MDHKVNGIRHNSCEKCQLPVFLAERVFIDKQIFHRSCLKCKTCSLSWTPDSFFQNGPYDFYCSETCMNGKLNMHSMEKINFNEPIAMKSDLETVNTKTEITEQILEMPKNNQIDQSSNEIYLQDCGHDTDQTKEHPSKEELLPKYRSQLELQILDVDVESKNLNVSPVFCEKETFSESSEDSTNPFSLHDSDTHHVDIQKEQTQNASLNKPKTNPPLNPFDSSDDEVELEKNLSGSNEKKLVLEEESQKPQFGVSQQRNISLLKDFL